MQLSPTIGEFAKSFAKFQSEAPALKKNGLVVGKKYSYRYASFDEVVSTIRETLAKHGLSFSQMPVSDGGRMGIVTLLMHESGEFIISEPFFMQVSGNDAQAAGSAISYAKRYSLTAALGIASEEEDDDAIQAMPRQTQNDRRVHYPQQNRQSAPPPPRQNQPSPPPQNQQQPPNQQPERSMTIHTDNMITPQQKKALESAVTYHAERNGSTVSQVYDTAARSCKIGDKPSRQLTRAEASKLIDYLNQKVK